MKAQYISSGIPLNIRSYKLYLQPLVYMPIWWPAVAKAWQRPVTTWVYKPEATNTVYSSWWWAVCRLKHVEPSKKLWNNKFYYKAASCWYFYWVFYLVKSNCYFCISKYLTGCPWAGWPESDLQPTVGYLNNPLTEILCTFLRFSGATTAKVLETGHDFRLTVHHYFIPH